MTGGPAALDARVDRVRREFAAQPFLALVGARLTAVEHSRVGAAMPVRPELTQQHGYVHAGALSTLLDVACGFAALSAVAEDRTVLTAELGVHLLRPARGERVVVEAEVLRVGRTLAVARATARAGSADDAGPGTPCAVMTATLSVLPAAQRRVRVERTRAGRT